MNKFTPGPWKILTHGMNAIVICPDGRQFDCGDRIYHPENDDNAKLISKAPEMYNMIKKLRHLLLIVFDENSDWVNIMNDSLLISEKLLKEIDNANING